MTSSKDRIQQLEILERELANALQSAGSGIQELSKDKPSIKQVENHTSSFMKTLENIEVGLTKHISYLTTVSTGQPHEGSSYAAQKDLHMALHRLEHVRSRLNEMDQSQTRHLQSFSTPTQQSAALATQDPGPPRIS